MRVMVLGATGMLGHKLVQTLAPRFEVVGAVRGDGRGWASHPAFARAVLRPGVDAQDPASLRRAIVETAPDVVINAVGIVKQLPQAKDPLPSLEINALLPHRLAQICRASGARLVHMSTDCVFSGRRGNYREDDVPDAEDLYGRSKLLGEVVGEGCLTLRTSMIGRELGRRSGLLEWFIAQRGGTAKGFARAIFSGLTTAALAGLIGDLIERHRDLAGLWHVAADPIDKYTLLGMVDRAFGLGVRLERDEAFHCDRSLDGSRFREATGFRAEPWARMIERLAEDPTPYDGRVEV
jgi:dTDP-4-dehydrorhamnose reductase